MMGIKHPLNVDWFWWEDVITTFIVNTVAIIFSKAQTLGWFKGFYIFPILDFFTVFYQRSVVDGFGSSPLMWLNTVVAYHWCYIYMSFCNTCHYRLVAVWCINLRNWWWGECLKPVFVEKRACIDTLTLRYRGDFLLIAADLLTGLSVLPICV